MHAGIPSKQEWENQFVQFNTDRLFLMCNIKDPTLFCFIFMFFDETIKLAEFTYGEITSPDILPRFAIGEDVDIFQNQLKHWKNGDYNFAIKTCQKLFGKEETEQIINTRGALMKIYTKFYSRIILQINANFPFA